MKSLLLALAFSLVLTGCNAPTADAGAGNTSPQAKLEAGRTLYAVDLILPVTSSRAPDFQYVTTDIARVDYTCISGNGELARPVQQGAYPGSALRLCVDLAASETIGKVVANNIMSLCFPSSPVLASATPFSSFSIFGIRAFNAAGRPARVHLTGVPCQRANALN